MAPSQTLSARARTMRGCRDGTLDERWSCRRRLLSMRGGFRNPRRTSSDLRSTTSTDSHLCRSLTGARYGAATSVASAKGVAMTPPAAASAAGLCTLVHSTNGNSQMAPRAGNFLHQILNPVHHPPAAGYSPFATSLSAMSSSAKSGCEDGRCNRQLAARVSNAFEYWETRRAIARRAAARVIAALRAAQQHGAATINYCALLCLWMANRRYTRSSSFASTPSSRRRLLSKRRRRCNWPPRCSRCAYWSRQKARSRLQSQDARRPCRHPLTRCSRAASSPRRAHLASRPYLHAPNGWATRIGCCWPRRLDGIPTLQSAARRMFIATRLD